MSEQRINARVRMLVGDVRDMLATLPDNSIDCVVTSPPYWGLRNYDVAGQIGLEPSLGEHIGVMIDVFEAVRRVLKPTGTLFLNYGDCYASSVNGRSAADTKSAGNDDRTFRDKPFSTVGPLWRPGNPDKNGGQSNRNGVTVDAASMLKPKDLLMIPNRLAIALQDAGWWVRSEIIWHKPNPMPESVYDRPTVSHEKVWLLTKSERYFYNAEAIREPVTGSAHMRVAHDNRVGFGHGTDKDERARQRVKTPGRNSRENYDRIPVSKKVHHPGGWDYGPGSHGTINKRGRTVGRYAAGVSPKSAEPGSGIKANSSFHEAISGPLLDTRNSRNVWTIPTAAYRDSHFATFPRALVERCIKAGCPDGGLVLDPFAGSGTVGMVADQLGRSSIMIELNPAYALMARKRVLEGK